MASAVVDAVAPPLNATVEPAPSVAGEIVPEMLQVAAVAVKFVPDTFALFMVTELFVGEKVTPLFVGVTT